MLSKKTYQVVDQRVNYYHDIPKKVQCSSEQKNFECAIELRNQISSIRLLSQNQIVDKERFFDQDVMAFKRIDEKLKVVQMSVRKGVLLGKKDFSLDFPGL